MTRAVKSEEEFVESAMPWTSSTRASGRCWKAYAPGKTEAEIMAPAVEDFFARGAGPRMMNIVLSGENGEAEAISKSPGIAVVGERPILYSLEITGTGCYWVEFSRP